MMRCWIFGQLTRKKTCKIRLAISHLNKIWLLISAISNQFFQLSFRAVLLPAVILTGCSVTRIYHEVPTSQIALSEINSIHVKHVQGVQSVLLSKILIHELDQFPQLNYLAVFPEVSKTNAAVLSAEVRRYSTIDEEKNLTQTHINLKEHEGLQKNPSGLNVIRRTFEFVEKTYTERTIQRTLDIEIAFKVTNIAGDKTLFFKIEKASIEKNYRGDENILLIPDSSDAMIQLAQLLIQKFLDRINPEKNEHVVELEKGTNPVPWTFGLLDFGHPRIIRSNLFATGNRYDLALKGWNYVLFEPRTYPRSERFYFSDEVYIRLKKAGLPQTTLRPLLEIHGKSFDHNEIKIVLSGLISNQDFERYAKIIKSHARFTQDINRLNYAAAHYNLGVVFQLRNELELSAYHFSQANAYNPNEKYSQAWTDLQHLKGGYKTLDSLMDYSVESFGKLPPPEGALLQPKTN